MNKYLPLIITVLFPGTSHASSSFMKDCDRHLRSEQSTMISNVKQMADDYRKTTTDKEELAKVDKAIKQFDEKINNQFQSLCTCIKDKTTNALKVSGLDDSEIDDSLSDLGKSMLQQNYFGIDEVTRKAFENAVLCSL